MNATDPRRRATNGFLPGADEDYPIFMPLVRPGGNVSRSVAFCREIHPGASILVPDLTKYGSASFRQSRNAEEILLDDLACFLRTSVEALEIALSPIIMIGHGSGADLATKFALRKNPHLASVMLFRPTASVASVPTKSLDALSVLLVTTELADDIGSSEWKIREAFSAAGAQVICEYVASGWRRSNYDAALARVFIASQFGLTG